jgi:hypothetical protein
MSLYLQHHEGPTSASCRCLLAIILCRIAPDDIELAEMSSIDEAIRRYLRYKVEDRYADWDYCIKMLILYFTNGSCGWEETIFAQRVLRSNGIRPDSMQTMSW